MSQYHNPIHPSIASQTRSQYSSLGGAIVGVRQPGFLLPNRRRVPQSFFQPKDPRKLQAGRTTPLHPSIPIDFKGYSRQGVKMIELYARGSAALSQMLEGANERVLAHTSLRQIALHIRWPGYEKFEWVRFIELHTSSGPITRAELAAAISTSFCRYIEKAQFVTPAIMDWYLGQAGISFDRLVLVSIVNVFESVWQADIAVDL